MKEFVVKHPVIVLLTAVTVCECIVRCTKAITKKKKIKEN